MNVPKPTDDMRNITINACFQECGSKQHQNNVHFCSVFCKGHWKSSCLWPTAVWLTSVNSDGRAHRHRWRQKGRTLFLGCKRGSWMNSFFPHKFPKCEWEFYCGWVIWHLRRWSKLCLGPCLAFPTLQLSCAVLQSAGFIYGLPAAISNLPFILLSAWEIGTVCSGSLFCYPNTRERGSQYPLGSHQAGDMKYYVSRAWNDPEKGSSPHLTDGETKP